MAFGFRFVGSILRGYDIYGGSEGSFDSAT